MATTGMERRKQCVADIHVDTCQIIGRVSKNTSFIYRLVAAITEQIPVCKIARR